MLIYEVNIRVEKAIAHDYSVWLKWHVDEMLNFDGFLAAEVFVPVGEPSSEYDEIVVHYRLKDRASLDNYLSRHAAAMRQQALDKFGDRLSIQRRTLVRIRQDEPGSGQIEQ